MAGNTSVRVLLIVSQFPRACKILHIQDLTPEDKVIFLGELEMMRCHAAYSFSTPRKLRSPYVVTLIGYTQIPKQKLSIVMEYIYNGSLLKLLDHPLSDKMKTKILLDVATGMAFLHNNNIYHR